MIKGGIGGGNTITGINFETKVDFLTLIDAQQGYTVKGNEIFYDGQVVALAFKKHGFYKYLAQKGVDWRSIISAQLFPDDAIFVITNNTFFILEIKFQGGTGSTDEKLQTCDFKIKQFRKLLAQLNVEVQYIYILNDWFTAPRYKDVLDYIITIPGCSFYFQYLPLQKLGLPVPVLKQESE